MKRRGRSVDSAEVEAHYCTHLSAIESGRYPTGSFQYGETLKVDESSGSRHPSIENFIFMSSWDNLLPMYSLR